MLRTVGLAFFCVTILSGCSAIRALTMPPEANLLSGAGSIVVSDDKADKFEQIDLAKLYSDYGFENRGVISTGFQDDSPEMKYRRNDMQDRILAASNQRCGTYIRELVASKSQTKMGWGGAALLLSGAASVVNPAHAAKILAAGSTAANGFEALYTDAYFNNLAINVISAGIARQREQILAQITAQRGKKMTEYPVNRAIADALQYHAACNMISGLEAAAAATRGLPNLTPETDPNVSKQETPPAAPKQKDKD